MPHAFPRQIGQLLIQLRDVGGVEFAREHHKGMLRFSLANLGFQDSIARYTKRQRNPNSVFCRNATEATAWSQGSCLIPPERRLVALL